MGQVYKLENQIQFVKAIKNNNPVVLKKLYIENYPKVEALILKNNGSVEHAKDIYQEAFITVWKHVKNNTFKPENESAIQGYLYRISKNKWIDVLRSKAFKNVSPLSSDILRLVKNTDEDTKDENSEENNRLNSIMIAFRDLGNPCKELLKLFYFNKKSLREVAQEFNIGENTARNKKYRCMEQLRTIVLASK